MAVELDKAEFVKCVNRKRFEVKVKTERRYINEIKKIAQFLYENCGYKSYWKEKELIFYTNDGIVTEIKRVNLIKYE